jgi:hypothetical protein
MNTEATTGEYMLLFRGPQWDKGLSPQELQQVMDKVMAWAERLQGQGKARGGQPLGAQGRIVSGKKGGFVADGPFAESKEAIGGYLVLRADDLNEAVEIARSNPILEYGVTIEVRPVLAECPVFQRARSQLLSEAVA